MLSELSPLQMNIHDLPVDMIKIIFTFLEGDDAINFRLSCKTFMELYKSKPLIQHICYSYGKCKHMSDINHPYYKCCNINSSLYKLFCAHNKVKKEGLEVDIEVSVILEKLFSSLILYEKKWQFEENACATLASTLQEDSFISCFATLFERIGKQYNMDVIVSSVKRAISLSKVAMRFFMRCMVRKKMFSVKTVILLITKIVNNNVDSNTQFYGENVMRMFLYTIFNNVHATLAQDPDKPTTSSDYKVCDCVLNDIRTLFCKQISSKCKDDIQKPVQIINCIESFVDMHLCLPCNCTNLLAQFTKRISPVNVREKARQNDIRRMDIMFDKLRSGNLSNNFITSKKESWSAMVSKHNVEEQSAQLQERMSKRKKSS